jgi:hypothetical protein
MNFDWWAKVIIKGVTRSINIEVFERVLSNADRGESQRAAEKKKVIVKELATAATSQHGHSRKKIAS